MPDRGLLYVAAGAGLGHLTRACAVAWHLAALGLQTRIVTHSLYAEGLSRLTSCAMEFIPAARWVRDAPRYVRALEPALVVLDTFPWGLRGEWRCVDQRLRFVTLARRLNVAAYLDAIGGPWMPQSPTLRHVIVCEPLSPEHQDLLNQSNGALFTLPGRIRFPAQQFPTPMPAALAAMLDRGRAWLVVHSGPAVELETLVRQAEAEMQQAGGGELAILSPRPIPNRATLEYFPAVRLYGAAARVLTGGGYNSVAELSPYPEKRCSVAFARRYDDQAGRLAAPASDMDGGPAAALVLRDLLQSGKAKR